MENQLVCPGLRLALVMLLRRPGALHSIRLVYCDRACFGRPLLALRSQQPGKALLTVGFPSGESKHGVRRSKSLSDLGLRDCWRSTRIVCSHTLVLARQSSTRESCIRHLAAEIVGFQSPGFLLVVSILLLLGREREPPSAATTDATNGWRIQHIITGW
jgi:hypothetical protein